MDIKNLIEFLPPIFKSNDTYKVNGKGFLERFLEICGEYFSDTITPDIDNILDIIQIDTTPKEYLNYLWEFLGEMPFANIYNVDVNKWEMYYDGTREHEGKWLLPNSGLISLTEHNARDLIRYSLSLLKIRGTHKFFTIISRLYGLEIKLKPITYPSYKAVNPHIDVDYLDDSSTDIKYEYPRCFDFQLTIDDSYHELVFADIDGKIIMGNDHQIFTGRSNYILPTVEGTDGDLEFFELFQLVNAYNEYKGKIDFKHLNELPNDVRIFVVLRRTLENFFNRFVPYDAKLNISYGESGIVPDDGITFDVLYEDPDNSFISDINPSVNLKVEIDSKWPEFDNRYMVSGNPDDWSIDNYHSDSLYKVEAPGTYYFKMVHGDKVIPVTIAMDMIPKTYSLSIQEGNILYLSDGNIRITPVAKYDSIPVGVTIKLPDGSKVNIDPGKSFTNLPGDGVYEVYVSNQPNIKQLVHVYDKPLDDSRAVVDIPYGVRVTIANKTSGYTVVLGDPGTFDDQNQWLVVDNDDSYEVIGVEPWLRNPNYPYNIMWGSEFITQPDKAVSILVRTANSPNSYHNPTRGSIPNMATEGSSTKGIEEAIKFLNNVLSSNTGPLSLLITLYQENISGYYNPFRTGYREVTGRGTTKRYEYSDYYHNPLFINKVDSRSGNVIEPVLGDSTLSVKLKNSGPSKVSILGLIGFDNTNTGSNSVPIWYTDSPSPSFKAPRYTSTIELSNSNVDLDISDLKFKVNGTTLRRQIIAMGIDDFGLFNTSTLYITDSGSDESGLMLDYNIDDTNWSVEVLEKPIEVKGIKVSKIYTYKLNNYLFGKDSAKFKFKLVIGGIIYNNKDQVIVDTDGNSYDTHSSYFKDLIRYYIPRQNGSAIIVGGSGYIFSAKVSDSNPNYNIMLNLVIDPSAPDRLDINLDMNPMEFYLPSNGKLALSNLIATRPYKYSMVEADGLEIVGPLEFEEGEDGYQIINPPILRYTTNKEGTHSFIADGVYDPLSILDGSNLAPITEEKVFIVYKNS